MIKPKRIGPDCSDDDAEYDDELVIDGSTIEPMVTWGTTWASYWHLSPCSIKNADDPATAADAFEFMGLTESQSVDSISIDVAFIGSCANGRFRLKGSRSHFKGQTSESPRSAMVVPVSASCSARSLRDFITFLRMQALSGTCGCSMCLAMNPDKLIGNQVCASSSTRNFIGRQGSPTGRTLLMSPAMVASAAIHGHIVDVRKELPK